MDWRVIRCRQCSQVYAGCRCWDLSAVEGRIPAALEPHVARARREISARVKRLRREAVDAALAKLRAAE